MLIKEPTHIKHIFVCVNELDNPEKDFCNKVGGSDIYFKLKEAVAQKGLVGLVYITRTRCLGFCNPVGTTIAVYTKGGDGKWYHQVKLEEVNTIIENELDLEQIKYLTSL